MSASEQPPIAPETGVPTATPAPSSPSATGRAGRWYCHSAASPRGAMRVGTGVSTQTWPPAGPGGPAGGRAASGYSVTSWSWPSCRPPPLPASPSVGTAATGLRSELRSWA